MLCCAGKSVFLVPKKAESGVRVCLHPPTSKKGSLGSSLQRTYGTHSFFFLLFWGFLFGVYGGRSWLLRLKLKAKGKAKEEELMLL